MGERRTIGTLLVANRGEIALRIFRTCRRLGLRSVAVYSDADRDALHVGAADEAVRIGPAPAAASYLDAGAILEAVRRTGADAVHPGYGFLSESAEFAEACAAAGAVFIGPPPAAMQLLGDKAAARRLAEELGVPVLPGIEVSDGAPEQAGALEFPVMIKAAAGGGGRGMRLVESPDALAEALVAARREVSAAFGDGRLLLERAVRGGRHVEVQVLADEHGGAVHLGERDCSTQRRYQKVIEETPSPAADGALRERMGEAALRLVRAAGYTNAGTVEFLLEPDGRFWLLEVNTRLQVEHGVTELVTGIDLVEQQMRIAAGEPLAFAQPDVRLEGHAIQCRVYAEDPQRGYVPSPGRIEQLAWPSGAGIRVDAGVEQGSSVPGEYDPLLAKVMAHGGTRAEALERCRRALDGTVVEGVRTNLGLLAAVLEHADFAAGCAGLDLLPSMAPADFEPRLPREVLEAAAATDLLSRAGADPWTSLGAWRVDGTASLAYRFHGRNFAVEGERVPGRPSAWRIGVDGDAREVGMQRTRDGVRLGWDDGSRTWRVAADGALLRLVAPEGHAFVLAPPEREGGRRAATTAARTSNELRAPMHGTVVAVHVEPGAQVRAGQPLVVLEAMKMEHAVEAPSGGVVAEVRCQPGQQVADGDVLVTLEVGVETTDAPA